MARDLSMPLAEITFHCSECDYRFCAAPGRVEDCPANDPHPWAYFADCPLCEVECGQIWWERNLMRTFGRQTGPKTVAGKVASSSNLQGEDSARYRFNGLKHGRYSKMKTFFEARPGQYAFCKSCEVPHDVCSKNQFCITQTGHMARIMESFENRDPSLIADMMAHKQAHYQAILDMCLLSIINEGVSIKEPVFKTDSEGESVSVDVIKAHPLLRFIADAFQKNSMAMSDLGMTPKVTADQAALKGYLDHDAESNQQSENYQRRQTEALEGLATLIENSRQASENDPIAIEYQDG